MSEFYIQCKFIIIGENCNKVIKNGSILVENNRIIAIGNKEEIIPLISGHDKIIRDNHIAIPSLVNSHTHLPETLLRGICDSSKLHEWLHDYIWPFERQLSADDAYYGALLGCLELIESGISGFIDQYFFVSSIEKAAKESQIRALLCPSLFDNTPESGSLEKTWKHVSSYLRSHSTTKSDLIKYGVGPHAPYTVPEEYLLKICDLSEEFSLPIHIHLNETEREVKEFKAKHEISPIEYINKIGMTKYRILGAHCVHTSKKDRIIMSESDFIVLHNPQSNLKICSGIAPIHQYISSGIHVAVGTDGNASNNDLGMLEELRTAAFLQKYYENNPTVINNKQALCLGTINGMKALGLESYGLSSGSLADITILSLDASHSWPQNDPLSNVVYSSSSRDVSDLIVNGEFVYNNREHMMLDKAKILEKCENISQRILSEMRN